GEVLQSYQDPSGAFPFVTGAIQTDEGVYVSSLTARAVGVLQLN
ncbi:MAG TPA: strictosidine synthase, partial [Alteromonas macleodii]|nr:strictosidine synthase [Alteromonas macleodii]